MILEAVRSAWWLVEPVVQLAAILVLTGAYAWLVGGRRRPRPPRVSCPTRWRYFSQAWHRCVLEDPLHEGSHSCACGSALPALRVRR